MISLNKMIPLSPTDLKVLYELDVNCRVSYGEIAKKYGMYLETVKKKIQRMERLKIIKGYTTVTNVCLLGYTVHYVFIEFCGITRTEFSQFIDHLNSLTSVSFVAHLSGNYDIMFALNTKDEHEYADLINSIEEKFGSSILTLDMSMGLNINYIPKKYLLSSIPAEVPIATIGGKGTYVVTPTDKKILNLLKKNARITSVDIANTLGINRNTVSKHIDDMVKNGFIAKFSPYIDWNLLEYKWYMCVFKLRRKSEANMGKLRSLACNHPNIVFMIDAVGRWDVIIDIHAKSIEECNEVVAHIRDELQGEIARKQLMCVLKKEKYKNL